ncbi:zinc metalloprotease HtpX [Streptococcus hongkongensis]|nr:heat shock protein HtpX [Streptococcus uberis]
MLYQQISQNKRRTIILVIGFFVLLTLIGAAAGYSLFSNYQLGIVIALIIGAIYAFSMIFQSTAVVMSMNNAREITVDQAPDFFHIVEDMAMVAQIPMPKVYIIDDPSLNAFATGSSPQNAAVAATSGLLQVMSREELEGVIGHEVSHIRNYDIRISTIAVALVSAITLISSIGGRMMWYGGGRRNNNGRNNDNGLGIILLVVSILSLILAPILASIIQLAISRQREFLADASSVELTRNPEGMIKALEKLNNSQSMVNSVDDASAALYINEPRNKEKISSLFSTHPPIEERIKRLKEM